MKKSRKAAFLAIFMAASISDAGYFSDINEIRSNRIFLGGGIRAAEGVGFTYQRGLKDNWVLEGSLGFFPLDGLHWAVGASYLWRQNKRFRPLVHGAVSYAGGAGPMVVDLRVNDGPVVQSNIETNSGVFGIVDGGFQFRIWKGLGLQYNVGFRQTITGGDYRINSTTSMDTTEMFLDFLTGTGVEFSGRWFWEF